MICIQAKTRLSNLHNRQLSYQVTSASTPYDLAVAVDMTKHVHIEHDAFHSSTSEEFRVSDTDDDYGSIESPGMPVLAHFETSFDAQHVLRQVLAKLKSIAEAPAASLPQHIKHEVKIAGLCLAISIPTSNNFQSAKQGSESF